MSDYNDSKYSGISGREEHTLTSPYKTNTET